MIQLEGRQDTLEFWTQEDARSHLQRQMLAAITNSVPTMPVEQPLPERPAPPPAMRSSLFGRKQSKAPEVNAAPKPIVPPITIEVQLDEVHFRTETEYGLYETLRGRAVLVTVDVR